MIVLGILGTVITLVVVAVILALIIWMWDKAWTPRHSYLTFLKALEFAIKCVLTVLGLFSIVAVVVYGISLSWPSLGILQ